MASQPVHDSLRRLEAWVEAENFRGWDPFDALNSPLLRGLTFGSRRLGQVWVQLLKRSPVNLRRVLGVPKGRNPKGIGLFLESYLRRYRETGEEADRARAEEFAAWLRDAVSPGYAGACWGYNFPWPNRGFYAPAGTPTVVNTAFIARALLEAGDTATARSACDFVLRDLNRLETAPDELFFSYTPLDRRWVYNASLLGAELLARVYGESGIGNRGSGPASPPPPRAEGEGEGKGEGEGEGEGGGAVSLEEMAEAAVRAARAVARRQEADGSWLYGLDASMDGWVDSFHTGFVLNSLLTVGECLGTAEFEDAVRAGYAYWRAELFRDDGAPRYYPDSDWPVDAHAVAQAILTYLAFADRDPEAVDRARELAEWAATHLQDPAGWFHYRIHRRYRIRIPYMRWSQAWMQRALRELVSLESGLEGRESSDRGRSEEDRGGE